MNKQIGIQDFALNDIIKTAYKILEMMQLGGHNSKGTITYRPTMKLTFNTESTVQDKKNLHL